jgi:hypothetical protein
MPGAKREAHTGKIVENAKGEKDGGRFKETVRKLLETPPKPWKPKGAISPSRKRRSGRT